MAEENLDRLHRRVSELESRVRQLEAVVGMAAAQPEAVTPPPVIQSPWELPKEEKPRERPVWEGFGSSWEARSPGTAAEPVAKRAKPPTPDGEAEYRFGAKVLPWVGAIAVVLGILFLVTIGIAQRVITLEMQFAGELALCAGFIGFGYYKRREREEFGKLLMGIGSCGLFLSFAGAYAFKNLISGEALVASFTALSLANLAYAWWQSSRAFFAIGMLGGLIAVALPMQERNSAVSAILYGLIAVPAALVAVRRSWSAGAAGLYALSLAALAPMLLLSKSWILSVGVLYAGTVLCLWAYYAVWASGKLDPTGIFGPVAAAVTATIGVSAIAWERTALAFAFGAVVVAFSLISRPEARQRLVLSGAIAGLIVAPFGYPPALVAAILPGLAILTFLVQPQRYARAFLLFGWAQLSLGLFAYVFSLPAKVPAQELTALSLLVIAGVIGAWRLSSAAADKAGEGLALIGLAVAVPAFARLGHMVLAASTSFEGFALASVAFSLVLAAGGVLAAALSRRSEVFSWAAASVLLAAGVLYLANALVTGRMPLGLEFALLLCLMPAMAIAGASLVGSGGVPREGALLGAGAAVTAVFARLAFVILDGVQLTMPSAGLAVWSLLATAAACVIVTAWMRSGATLTLGWLWLLAAALPYFMFLNTSPTWIQEVRLLLPAAAVAWAAWGVMEWRGLIPAHAVTELRTGAAIVCGYLTITTAHLALTQSSLAWPGTPVAVSLVLAYSGALVLFARSTREPSGLVGASLGWSTAVLLYLLGIIPTARVRPGLESILLLGICALIVWVLSEAVRMKRLEREAAAWLSVLCVFPFFSRLGFVALSSAGVGVTLSPSLTITWTVFALCCVTIGLVFRFKALRLASFGVFGLTLMKIVAMDMAGLEMALRAVVMIVLGLALLAAGYGYIRLRETVFK